MKKTLKIAAPILVAAVLSACGGGGDDSSTNNGGSNGGGNNGGGNTSGTTATCSGTARTSTSYDVFLPTANGIAQSSASRNVQLYGQATDNSQCISIAGSTAQADSSPGTIQVATTDNWNNAISYADPVGTTAPGGVKLNQGVILTCTNGNDMVRHAAIYNPMGTSSTFVSSNQVATTAKNTEFRSYECIQSGSTSTPGFSGTVVTFAADGSVTVADPTGNTTITASNVPSLFTQAGYNLNGKILRWYLYQLPTGAGTKQAIVHTAQRSDGTYGVDVFLNQ